MACGNFFKHFTMMSYNSLTKESLVNSLNEFLFNCATLAKFWPNLCSFMSQKIILLIHFLKIFDVSIIGCNSQTKALFTKIIPFLGKDNLCRNYAVLCFKIHSLEIFLNFCSMMRHNRQTKVALIFFLITSSLGTMWDQLGPKLHNIVSH